MIVDGRHPQVAGSGRLGGLILARLPADFYDEIEQVVPPVPIVEEHDVVWNVAMLLALERIRDSETQIEILGVSYDLLHLLQRLRHLGFPTAVERNVLDLTFLGIGAVDFASGIEVHVSRGAYGIEGSQDRPYRAALGTSRNNRAVDLVDSLVR